ncbi:hypothetical protein LOKVESSMR4R_02399 [Yoonia vestfoldensis]|uniref:Uncharacterized protein n=2 Tax=Yoonia vestfoldensis TaxID=245188 RepID=A0A1Y0EDL8_9RHOB|nr:hypothetical protein LOKVESSMR4R_02399 [Yoonia vestfoldensis]
MLLSDARKLDPTYLDALANLGMCRIAQINIKMLLSCLKKLMHSDQAT